MQERRWEFVIVLITILLGVVLGTVSEVIATQMDINLSRIAAALLLSPITLTVGGGHFPDIPSVRWFFGIQGLATVPVISCLSIYAYRTNSTAMYVCLLLVVAYLYFGLLHRHDAIMSI